MGKVLLTLTLLLSSFAYALPDVVLEEYRQAAERDVKNFLPKEFTQKVDIKLSFQPSAQGFFILFQDKFVGIAIPYQRCSANVNSNQQLDIECYDGVTGSVDLCRILPQICEFSKSDKKLRELYIDPNVSRLGETMRGLGKHDLNPHIGGLTEIVRQNAAAANALVRAMVLNDCTSIELGDIAGTIDYLEQRALADDDTKKVIPEARNRWRAQMRCRSGASTVYLDVLMAVVGQDIVTSLIPVKANADTPVVIERVKPTL